MAYDEHADLLYDLAEQVVAHLCSYLSAADARKVLRLHQREIAQFVHAQMQQHFWQETDVDYDVVVTRGFTALRPSAYTAAAGDQPHDLRMSPADKSNMSRYLFGGFKRCLYSVQKFQSDAERKLAVVLDREALKWFKPAKGQFQLFYQGGPTISNTNRISSRRLIPQSSCWSRRAQTRCPIRTSSQSKQWL